MGRNIREKAAQRGGEIRHPKDKATSVYGRVRSFNISRFTAIILALKSVLASATGKPLSFPPLSTYEQALLTTALTEFAGNEEVFTAATHWSKDKLRFSKAASGPFLGCAEYGQGQRALSDLQLLFGADSARAVSQSPENGSCFIVTASHSGADAVLQDPSLAGLVSFGPFPCAMKIAPGLLEFSGLGDSKRLSTTHGRSIRMDNVEGINLELSPGTLPAHDSGAASLMQRLYEYLLSSELDLRATSFWSDSSPVEEGSARSHPEGALRVREWRRATQVVHKLSLAAETSPGDICSWGEISFHHADDDVLLVSGVEHLLYGGRGVGGVGEEATESQVACFMSLLSTLAAVPEVLRISPRHEKVLHNAAAFKTIQSGAAGGTPFTDLGLDGTGEIIQVVDTGLDYSSCFFIDEDGEAVARGHYYEEVGFPPSYYGFYGYDSSSKAAVVFNGGDFHADLTRRKLVQYISLVRSDDTEEGHQYGDSFVTSGGNRYSWVAGDDFEYDYEAGHGTHVAGSAVGSTLSSNPDMVTCVGDKEMGCVGGCIDPDASTDDLAASSLQWSLLYDIDRLCPRLDCDGLDVGSEICLDDDEVTNVVEHGGMARGAKLSVFDIFYGYTTFGPSMMGNGIWAPAVEIDAKIHSNSWGAFLECQPDVMDIIYDDFMYQNPENLLLFSAGNDGDYDSDGTTCTIGSPALAKNVLTVGASCSGETRVSATGADGDAYDGSGAFADIDTVAYFSSYGPTHDDRIKPEVVAPGDQVYSATSDASEDEYSCRLWMYAGTSMSCPIVAGATALIRQYFRDPDFYAKDMEDRGFCSGTPSWSSTCSEFAPSAATLKALLINSANLMGGSTEPDGYRGFGRIQLDAGLPVNGEGRLALFVADAAVTSIASLTRHEYAFYVDGSAGLDLRATLSWIDPATSPYSAKQLLHDLDLSLMAPSGFRYTMWRTGRVDSTNVNERVIVPATLMESETGVWQVWVWAKSLTTSTQAYSLVVTGAISPSLPVNGTTSSSSTP